VKGLNQVGLEVRAWTDKSREKNLDREVEKFRKDPGPFFYVVKEAGDVVLPDPPGFEDLISLMLV
jgi:hypothetical protein